MSNQRFFIGCICISLSLLLIFATIVFFVDPLYLYHLPYFGYQIDVFDEFYQNAGLAKNADYDAVIIGSSMTENFRTSVFDECFGFHTIKLPFPGGRIAEQKYLLENIFKTHAPRAVFLSMDEYAFYESPGLVRSALPAYLYDNNPFNDVNYLFNKGIFFDVLIKFVQDNRANNTRTSFDDAYSWYWAYTFSKEAAMSSYARPAIAEQQAPPSAYLPNAKENLNEILAFVKGNPETEFYLFFPPVSILFWDARVRLGIFEASMAMQEYLITTLLPYENVKVFYFCTLESIITDLENYKDLEHYNVDINDLIARSMARDVCLLTEENCKSELRKLREIVENYDFESLFEEQDAQQ